MPQKGLEFKLKVPIETLSFVNPLKVEERKWIKGFTSKEVIPFNLRKQNRMKNP